MSGQKHESRRVNISVLIPAGYRWIACQPYGTWFAFKRKPRVYVAWEDREGDGFVPRYWKVQADELELSIHGGDCGTWRQTLVRLW